MVVPIRFDCIVSETNLNPRIGLSDRQVQLITEVFSPLHAVSSSPSFL